MAEGAGIGKADAGRALDAFIDATSNALKGGERVALVGFGSFSVTHREARKGRNPQTQGNHHRRQERGEVQARCRADEKVK